MLARIVTQYGLYSIKVGEIAMVKMPTTSSTNKVPPPFSGLTKSSKEPKVEAADKRHEEDMSKIEAEDMALFNRTFDYSKV